MSWLLQNNNWFIVAMAFLGIASIIGFSLVGGWGIKVPPRPPKLKSWKRP